MLRKLAAVDPLPPELARRRVLRSRPCQRDIRFLALAKGLGGMRSGAFEAHSQIRHQPQRDVSVAPLGDGLPIARPGVLPVRGRLTVIEDGMAGEAQLDAADDAFRRAQEDVLRFLVGGWAAVRPRAPLAVVPGTDAQRVADDQPARARPPRGLQDE